MDSPIRWNRLPLLVVVSPALGVVCGITAKMIISSVDFTDMAINYKSKLSI